jgi:hypothetical protein
LLRHDEHRRHPFQGKGFERGKKPFQWHVTVISVNVSDPDRKEAKGVKGSDFE